MPPFHFRNYLRPVKRKTIFTTCKRRQAYYWSPVFRYRGFRPSVAAFGQTYVSELREDFREQVQSYQAC